MPLTDTSELVATKLAVPRPRSSLVRREGLFTRLDKGLAREVTLITAPPGFGKTTLVSEWAATRQQPVAWVSLDAGDNDPVRFWRYVITACRTFDAALKSSLAALRASQQPSFESVLTSFVNELARLPDQHVLVLDDYHVITSPEVHQTLAFLLDHFPLSLHLVLITRSEPPLPLARLRARDELSELSAADLRFSPQEIQNFFQRALGTPLPDDALAHIEARTEGWAAGLRLLALALEGKDGQPTTDKILKTFTGVDIRILDYLVGEVLAGQEPAVQEFLLQTSFLTRLTPALCEAVTGRTDSARLLEQLARANLFVLPLGEAGEQRWYRYHTLFAEAMRHQAQQRYGEAALRELYDKAAFWYEAHGLLSEAVEAFIVAQAFERAATLIERILEQRDTGELYTMSRWVQQLPQAVVDRHPDLSFTYATAILFTSDRYSPAIVRRIEVPLRAAEQAWNREKNDPKLGEVLSLRGMMIFWQGDLAQAVAYSSKALELLSEDDVMWRGVSVISVAYAELLAGRLNAAQPLFLEGRALCEAAQNIHGSLAAMQGLAEISYRQGDFDQASEYYQQILAEARGREDMLDDLANSFAWLGAIALARNELDSAEQYASRALEPAERRGEEMDLALATITLARIQQARGQAEQATQTLQTLAARVRLALPRSQVQAWQARLALTHGDMASIEQWYAMLPQSDDNIPRVQQELEALTIARMHIANHKSEAALELLEPWRIDARTEGRTLSELETLILKALAYAAQSDMERAKKTLVRALVIAQPKNCQRVFLDEGERMATLLRATLPELEKRPLAAFATLLLHALTPMRVAQPASKSSASLPLIEPLSSQEQRVLRLLANGLSNPEIARELVVSTNTIKTQVQSIYRKLNVTNRAEAADMARQLNLL